MLEVKYLGWLEIDDVHKYPRRFRPRRGNIRQMSMVVRFYRLVSWPKNFPTPAKVPAPRLAGCEWMWRGAETTLWRRLSTGDGGGRESGV